MLFRLVEGSHFSEGNRCSQCQERDSKTPNGMGRREMHGASECDLTVIWRIIPFFCPTVNRIIQNVRNWVNSSVDPTERPRKINGRQTSRTEKSIFRSPLNCWWKSKQQYSFHWTRQVKKSFPLARWNCAPIDLTTLGCTMHSSSTLRAVRRSTSV